MDVGQKIPDYSRTRILVVGDVMLDSYFWGDVDNISPEAPVPVMKVREKSSALGGAGNVAANLVGLGCQTTLIGVCGKDKGARELETLLRNLDVENILIPWEGISTTTKIRVMGFRQQLVRLDEENTQEYPEEIAAQVKKCFDVALANVDGVILSDYGKGMISRSLGSYFTNKCSEAGVPVFIDPKRKDWEIYSGGKCLTPNSQEFQHACYNYMEYQDLETQVQALLRGCGLEYLLVTQGEQGMTLFGVNERPVKMEPIAREVYDVSGAGDTVVATLASSYCSGMSMSESGFIANYAASVVVGKSGVQPVKLSDLYQSLRAADLGSGYKIFRLQQAKELVQRWKEENNTVVFTNGCFDLLHSGHIKLFQKSLELGDKLVVGVNSDFSIKRIKGENRPIMAEQERIAILAELESIDSVVVFEEDTPWELIKTLQPDILVKGDDYRPEEVLGKDLVESWGGRLELIPVQTQKSSTRILKRIQNN